MPENLQYRSGVSVTVSAYWVEEPIYRDEAPAKWFGVATAHVFDPNRKVKALTDAQVVVAGETMVVVSVRTCADGERRALVTATESMADQLAHHGYGCDPKSTRA